MGNVEVVETPAALLAEMKACEAKILGLPEPRAVLEGPQISATRAGYKALGKDPARYRFSRSAAKAHSERKELSADWRGCGRHQSGFGRKPPAYRALRSGQRTGRHRVAGGPRRGNLQRDREVRLESGRAAGVCDAAGPHGSPTSDSERTMVTPATKRIAAILVGFGGSEGLERWCQRMTTLLQQYAQGHAIETKVVS